MRKYNTARMEQSDRFNGAFGTVTEKSKTSADKEASPDEKSDAISKHLKDAYRSVVDEPLPDVFEDLLNQLDERVEQGSSSASGGSEDQ